MAISLIFHALLRPSSLLFFWNTTSQMIMNRTFHGNFQDAFLMLLHGVSLPLGVPGV